MNMTHEFKEIVCKAYENTQNGIANVMATVLHLEGSSYRKEGVRMLIDAQGNMTGAVSGGCVEKEVCRRAQSVFKNGKAKVITYDGRYRLGCEGTLYILIEKFEVSDAFFEAFQQELKHRHTFTITSYFKKEDNAIGNFGSVVSFKTGRHFAFSDAIEETETVFSQQLQPSFKLIIIGGEHDAVKLCKMASLLGWDIDVITSMKDYKQLSDFDGAASVVGQSPETIQFKDINDNTAIVLMNHNYVRDLQYVIKLSEHRPKYIGILGAAKRRERLFNELFDYVAEVSEAFLDTIYTPAGLNIGAETPEEIALSILAEIQMVITKKEPFSLRNITGNIHA